MLDMGFIRDIRKIIAALPRKRQTLLFSATMPRRIAELAEQMLRDPVRVAVTPPPPRRTASRSASSRRPCGKAAAARATCCERPSQPRAGLRPHQAWCGPGGRELGQGGIAAAAIHGNKSQSRASGRSTGSATASCASWWRPTSPPAASTSRASATSSTTICPRPRPTCTGSAAPHVRVPRVWQFHSVPRMRRPCCVPSRS